MQAYSERLICFVLLITITSAEITINSFRASETTADNNRSNIYSEQVRLWADVTGCTPAACQCEVQNNGYDDEPQSLDLGEEHFGSVDITNLKPSTNYSFTLTCQGNPSPATQTLNLTTDFGRPSAPRNLASLLASKHVNITWLPPSIAEEAFSYYTITIDNQPVEKHYPKTSTSYQMLKEYEDGIKHTFNIAACYINNQKQTFCSNKNEATGTFLRAVTEAPKSTGISSYSISMILFFLSLIHQIKP